jgi:hypothetical protein
MAVGGFGFAKVVIYGQHVDLVILSSCNLVKSVFLSEAKDPYSRYIFSGR